jgi:hypothetical protein
MGGLETVGVTLRPLPAPQVPQENLLRFEPVQESPVDLPQALAQHLLREAEQLRRVATASADTVIGDELMNLVGLCGAAAAALLIHASGHWDKVTSHLFDR